MLAPFGVVMFTAPPELAELMAAPVMLTAPAAEEPDPLPLAAVIVVEPELLVPGPPPIPAPLETVTEPPAPFARVALPAVTKRDCALPDAGEPDLIVSAWSVGPRI